MHNTLSSSSSSAAHATAGRWPPQFIPLHSIPSYMSPSFPCFFLYAISPSSFWSASSPFSFYRCPFCRDLCPFAVIHTCNMLAHCSFMLPIRSIISVTLVLSLIVTFLILSCLVILRIVLSMLLCATASLFSWRFVRVHVSAPYVIDGRMIVSKIFFLRQLGIFLSFEKQLC